MEKLALMLVLAMASTASATIQISVGGDSDPVDSEYTLQEGETLSLEIWDDAERPPYTATEWMLVVDTTLGDISEGAVAFEPGPFFLGATLINESVIPPPGMEGVWGVAFTRENPVPADTTYYDGILFTCEGVGDTTIYLMDCPDSVQASIIYDTVVIHQIPEPMTLLLLGLGAVMLRRKHD